METTIEPVVIKKPNKMKNLVENFPKHISTPIQIFLINLISTPFERFQIINQIKPQLKNFGIYYKNNTTILKDILQEKKSSLFKGLRINIYSSIFTQYLSTRVYFKMKKRLSYFITENPKNPSIALNGLTTLFSTLIISTFLHPLEVCKVKLMSEISPLKKNIYGRFYKTFDEIKFNEGWKALYRGYIFGIWKNLISMGLSLFLLNQFDKEISQNKIYGYSTIAFAQGVLLYPMDTILKNFMFQGAFNNKASVVGNYAVFQGCFKNPFSLYGGVQFYFLRSLSMVVMQDAFRRANMGGL